MVIGEGQVRCGTFSASVFDKLDTSNSEDVSQTMSLLHLMITPLLEFPKGLYALSTA